MDQSQTSISSADFDLMTVHDFNNERLLMMVLGGYVILRKPTFHFVLNILYLAFVYLVYILLVVTAVATIIYESDKKVTVVRVVQTLCLLLVGISLSASKLVSENKMKQALKLIRKGVHTYLNEVHDEEYFKIKKERVDQIRYLMKYITKLCFSCAFSNTFFVPFIQFLTSKEDTRSQLLNPYLPLPLYMPFNTRTYFGYGIAFISNAIFFFFLYATIACLIETYLSTSLQLVAQIELLNASLEKIEQRARLKIYKSSTKYSALSTSELYDNSEFQRQLYLCLRENVRHHHAVQR